MTSGVTDTLKNTHTDGTDFIPSTADAGGNNPLLGPYAIVVASHYKEYHEYNDFMIYGHLASTS